MSLICLCAWSCSSPQFSAAGGTRGWPEGKWRWYGELGPREWWGHDANSLEWHDHWSCQGEKPPQGLQHFHRSYGFSACQKVFYIALCGVKTVWTHVHRTQKNRTTNLQPYCWENIECALNGKLQFGVSLVWLKTNQKKKGKLAA